MSCAYTPDIRITDGPALAWLFRVLRAIDATPGHRNHENAATCSRVIRELLSHGHLAHDLCHKKDERIDELEHEVAMLRQHNESLQAIIAEVEHGATS